MKKKIKLGMTQWLRSETLKKGDRWGGDPAAGIPMTGGKLLGKPGEELPISWSRQVPWWEGAWLF